MSPEALIAPLAERLRAEFGLTPVTASEIEFYLSGADEALPAFWDGVKEVCAQTGITLFKTEKEKGAGQHEAALAPINDPVKTARDTQALRQIITGAAQAQGLSADFSARPFPDQPGSGLHVHVHLVDAQGKNVFYKDDERISDALKWSIGGLLATMRDHMRVFAPHPESRARFTPGGMAPTTVSWGANNRTVAVRLPDAYPDQKRIEHRVAGADADPVQVMAAILAGIHHGLVYHCEPGPQIYGDAGLEMYGLPLLSS